MLKYIGNEIKETKNLLSKLKAFAIKHNDTEIWKTYKDLQFRIFILGFSILSLIMSLISLIVVILR